jgi:RNA polymerase sigma-70 factor (ECF subfamily)
MNERILYVEDEEDFQLLVSRILEGAGLKVEVAATGQEGMAALTRSRPALMILDVNLPDTTGYMLCRQIRQDPAWSDLPILMLTVRQRPEEWLEGFSSGANDYVTKPINPPDLIEQVLTCLAGKCQWGNPLQRPEFLLSQAIIAGNRGAFDMLVRRYKSQLLEAMAGYATGRAEAEDIVSAAFLRALERMDQYKGQASFYTWLYSIAFHELTHRRRESKPISLDEYSNLEHKQLMVRTAESEPWAIDSAIAADVALLEETIAKVPEPYRQILELHFFKEMPYEALAAHLQIPQGTVMSRLFKARELLRKSWREVSAGRASSV